MEFKSLNGYLVKDEIARGQIEELGTSVSNAQAEVVDIKEENVQTKEAILNLQKNMSSVNENVANVNTLISDTTTTIQTIQRDVTTAIGSTTTLSSDVETLKSDNETQKLDILTLKTNNSDNATRITDVERDVFSLNERFENHKTPNDATNKLDLSTLIRFVPEVGSNYDNYGGSYYYKVGTRVHVHVGLRGLTANTYTKVFTLPEGFRPHHAIVGVGMGEGATHLITLAIESNGECIIYPDDEFAEVDVEFDSFN